MILKIQRPLYSTSLADMQTILIYNESKSLFTQLRCSNRVSKYFKKKHRIFVDGTVRNGQLIINKVLPDQDW